ncbi:UDP-glucose 6-dehydrogenase [Candidatus Shapirobacteria bacterium CG09_land_8_20_14_0_10_47_13]|uniref:UDP-glucose 6-dehydrogenase n=1 Tax=Candidatus Shapirobacteria bacterium CG09_land_8_20_14_0_10_47_13 TaxID=1974481 RepID=A0A2H0WMD8_9BACT|nr:MAG: UDP-glucose 6-dehydrogenase [Candidatus Shapirobacteria bacterium CG09_land_8_20_14_0_10_47_13]
MKIAVVGAGYVGLTWAIILADQGHHVWLLRKDKAKNEALKKGKPHIFEPGLTDLVKKNLRLGRLLPTLDYQEAIPNVEAIFICVGTPSGLNGKADLSQVLAAASEIGKNLRPGFTAVIVKSTVPPGTTAKIAAMISKHKSTQADFEIGFCPEFLREGSAVADSLHPDRVIVGTASPKVIQLVKELHRHLPTPVLVTSIKSAELTKYAANNYLALRIVFINQIADLCEKIGADVQEIIAGIGSDKRIGPHYWYPGLGYGGSCFPKDVAALAWFAEESRMKDSLFAKMDKINRGRVGQIALRLEKKMGALAGKKIAVLGLAVKQGTDDVRCSPAMDLVEILLKKGAHIKAYDPLATNNARRVLKAEFFPDPYGAVKDADGLFILNDSPEFAKLDYVKLKKLMRGNFIFDSRNLLNKKKMEKLGFVYGGIGK